MIRLMLLLGLASFVCSSTSAQTPIPKDLTGGNTVVVQSGGTLIIQAPTPTPVKEVAPVAEKRQWFPWIHRIVDNNRSGNCGDYGCPNPLGCGNFHTDFRFVFGSCRHFFGTSAGTVDHSKYPQIKDPTDR